jgi:mono/diheme cytochrome c family protein
MRKAVRVALTMATLASQASAQDRAAIAAGREIYVDKCETCHGVGLEPTGAGADLRELRAEDRPKYDKTLKEGRNQMPSWDGQFSAEQIEQIWAYIRSRAND